MGIYSNPVLTLVSFLRVAVTSNCDGVLHLEEGLDFLCVLWSSSVLDVYDLSQVGRHPFSQVNVAKPHNCLCTQLSFLASDPNSILMQPLGTGIKILVMFVTLAVYEDVVLDNQHALWPL